MTYLLIKTIHIISATILFGTGLGIAFFMFRSHFTSDIQQKLYAAKTTVLADYLFTLPAVITQFLTGIYLVSNSGFPWNSTWLLTTYGIFILAGLCWIPVVFIQLKMRDILEDCSKNNKPIPPNYFQLFKTWILLGIPAFLGLVVVFGMMVFKPA